MAATTSWRRKFVIFWAGQFVALTGLAFAMYALGVYIYELSNSSATLGLAFAFPIVPFVLSAPFGGALVDRWGPRRALVVSNIVGLLNLVCLTVLHATDTFAVGRVWLFLLLAAAFKSMHLAAFETAVPLLVPKDKLSRANGGRMALTAVGALIGPVIAGPLLDALGFYGVIAMACVTFALSLLSLAYVEIPTIPRLITRATPARLLAEFWQACQYILVRRGLAALFICLAAVNAGIGSAELLMTQLTLSFTSAGGLDVILVSGAVGLVLGTFVMVCFGGPRQRVRGLIGFALLMAAAMVIGGVRPNVALLAVAAFFFLGSTPIIIGTIQTLEQLKVEPHLLGRTAAVRDVFIDGPYMLAEMLVGFAAGVAFVPLVGEHHVHSAVVRAVVGGGAGRGYALLMMVVGVLLAACIVVTYRVTRVRHIEQDLPDVTPSDLLGEPADAELAAPLAGLAPTEERMAESRR